MNLVALTATTCGDACWHAREEVCRCSCVGRNHGILRNGGPQPQRTCKIENLYELVAVIPGRMDRECWIDVENRIRAERNRILAERFPGIDLFAYGEYREERYAPVLDRKPSATQLKWPEVAAIPNAARLLWARPVGTRYLVRGQNYKAVYADAL